MTSITKTFAWISLIGGILFGFLNGFVYDAGLATMFYWVAGGIILCVIFVVLTCLLEELHVLQAKLDTLLSKTTTATFAYPEKGKNSPKPSLDSVKDFKLPHMD